MTFSEDPGYYHERIIGGEVFPGDYLIATCDGDEYVEKSTWWSKAWLLTSAKSYPKELRGEVLPFELPWTDAEMVTFVKRMREIVLSIRAVQPTRRTGRDFNPLLCLGRGGPCSAAARSFCRGASSARWEESGSAR